MVTAPVSSPVTGCERGWQVLRAWPVGADAAVAGPDWPYGGLWRGGWGTWPERAFWWLWRAVRACGGPRGGCRGVAQRGAEVAWCGLCVPEPPRSECA